MTEKVYTHTSKWIKETLVYGDTYAWFVDMIPKPAIDIACNACAAHVANLLQDIGNYNFSSLWNIIKLSCPFPGFVKKPNTVDLFMDNHIPDYVEPIDLIYSLYQDKAFDNDNVLVQNLLNYACDCEMRPEDIDVWKFPDSIKDAIKYELRTGAALAENAKAAPINTKIQQAYDELAANRTSHPSAGVAIPQCSAQDFVKFLVENE
jgi:hypothetical protein